MRIDGPVILTYSGRYVEPLNLRPEDVVIEDIAHALSNQCRYSGHTREFYSVAQHSCLVSDGLPSHEELWGLLHDASEAYLVDLPRPLKHAPMFGRYYRDAERRAMLAICERFGLSPAEPQGVKIADLVLLATERRDLMPENGEWAILGGVHPLSTPLMPWAPRIAEEEFHLRFYEYTRKAA